MLLQIANYTEATRVTAVAGAALPIGSVVKIVDDGTGARKAMPLLDTDAAALLPGQYGVVTKVSADPYQVDRTTAPTFTGIRTVAIAQGDYVVQVLEAFLDFDPSLLHTSLDASRGGTKPTVGQALAIKGGLFCTAATVGAITSPVIAHVHEVSPTGRVTIWVDDEPYTA